MALNECKSYIDKHFDLYVSSNVKETLASIEPFNFSDFSQESVSKELASIKQGSAPGSVGIEAKVFKYCSDELSSILMRLFNLCLRSGRIPAEWKIAFIKPIPKPKADKRQVSNYRPISTLPPVAKVFESLISHQIEVFFERNELLSENQYGFRRNRSCELALNSMLDGWRKSLNEKKKPIAVFLDLSKVFDTICHKLLLIKLSKYKFSLAATNLIANYLNDR